MLHVVYSNQLEELAKALCQQLASNQSSLFEADTILVQSPGMATWLKCEIAAQLSIAANIDFPMPSSWIWQIYRRLMPSSPPEYSLYQKNHMTWLLMSILPRLLKDEAFGELARYVEGSHRNQRIARYALCCKIADVFDHYLVYRPEWIDAWSNNQKLDLAPSSHEHWQRSLWHQVTKFIRENAPNQVHRIEIINNIFAELEQNPQAKNKLPNKVYLFGISALPPQLLGFFQRLGQWIDVVVFQFNPCMHYWGDIVDRKSFTKNQLENEEDEDNYLSVGNPLLASWGKVGKEYLDLMLDSADIIHDSFVDAAPKTILQHIQQDILQLEYRGHSQALTLADLKENIGQRPLSAYDTSVIFNDCHHPLREIEVLHDHLLHCFANDAALEPKDILVMAPDITQYLPYIDAIFGMQAEAFYIPYAVSDIGPNQSSNLGKLVLRLLALYQERFSLTHVMDLLSYPQVYLSFGFRQEDMAKVEGMLDAANIRWGIDGDHKALWDLPTLEHNTWSFGFNRILSGFAFLGDADDNLDYVPLTELSPEHFELFGKFMRFFRHIQTIQRFTLDEHRLSEWAIFIRDEIVTLLTTNNEPDKRAKEVILTMTEELEKQDTLHEAIEEAAIPAAVLCSHLQGTLDNVSDSQWFFMGKVNFCTLLPMRSIPFKHICLLGMNDTDFPRHLSPLSFDLISTNPARRGDRLRRADDQYLFLEALLSARKQLYLSYLGRNQQDNQKKFPSIVVQEFIEYCNDSFFCDFDEAMLPTEALTREHAIQPFSSLYYQKNEYQSFQSLWVPERKIENPPNEKSSKQPKLPVILAKKTNFQSLSLEDFKFFFANPTRFFYQNILEINLYSSIKLAQDDEGITLESDTLRDIEKHLISEYFSNRPGASIRTLQRGGEVLDNAYGSVLLESSTTKVDKLLDQFKALNVKLLKDALRVNWQDSKRQIHGNLALVSDLGYTNFSLGKLSGKLVLDAWLNHLFQTLGDSPKPSIVLTPGDKPHQLKPLTRNQAEYHLNDLSSLMNEGLDGPLALFPNTAYACAPHVHNEQRWDEAFDKQWFSSAYHFGEGDEAHIARAFPDMSAANANFRELSLKVFEPILEHLEKLK